jgi:hypothetical protein
MKVGLKEAAVSIGIAFESPAEGLTRLRRSGITFNEEEKKTIQGLVDAGRAAEAQSAILDKLEKKVGGFAASTVTSLEAAKGKWRDWLEDIQRGVGKTISASLEPLADAFMSVIPTDVASEFEKVSKNVTDLQMNVLPLLDRYDKLSTKSALSKKEQAELGTIVETVAGMVPGAVTQWDAYAKAIGISTDKVREFISEQQAAQRYLNMAAIDVAQERLAKVNEEMARLQTILAQGGETKFVSAGVGGGGAKILEKYSADQLQAVSASLRNQAERKKEIEAGLRALKGEVVPPSGGGGGPAPGKVTDDVMKARLASMREVLGAEYRLNEQRINDDYLREKQAIEDKKKLRMREIDDEQKTGLKDVQTIANLRKAANLTADAEMEKLDRDHKEKLVKNAEDEIKKKEAFDARYASERETFDRNLVDQQIRNYALSADEFKKYLDKKLEDEIDWFRARNKEIEDWNRKHPEDKKLPFNIGAYRAAGQTENQNQVSQYTEGKAQHDIGDWRKNNELMADATNSAINSITGEWGNALTSMISQGQSFAEATTHTWTNMANQIIASLLRIGTQYLMLLAVKELFSGATGGFGGFLIKALGGATGGEFSVAGDGIKRMASGGSFVVPSGFTNDTFPLLVSSGERVNVTSRNQMRAEQLDMTKIVRRLDVISVNLQNQRQTIGGRISVDVEGEYSGRDIFLANRRAGRVYSRIH